MLTDFEQKELERLKSLTGVHTMSGEDIPDPQLVMPWVFVFMAVVNWLKR